MSELKPCPFCGREAEMKTFVSVRLRLWKMVGYFAECSVCKNKTAMSLDERDVINAWNRRADNER